MAYLSLFPIGSTMRANLMVYRDMNDPWLRKLRFEPEAALLEAMPNLSKLRARSPPRAPSRLGPPTST